MSDDAPDATLQEQVEALGRKWQAILRLQDWFIDFAVKRYHEIEDHALAHTRRSVGRQHAEIWLRDPADHPASLAWPGDYNVELAIVHELMHLKLTRIGIPKEREEFEEEAVESMARILIKLESGRCPAQAGLLDAAAPVG